MKSVAQSVERLKPQGFTHFQTFAWYPGRLAMVNLSRRRLRVQIPPLFIDRIEKAKDRYEERGGTADTHCSRKAFPSPTLV